MKFFVGLDAPQHAKNFTAAFISVNRLRRRKAPFQVADWIMDSGAFTEISTHGHYRHSVEEYAEQIRRWSANGNLVAAVSQDYMCEPFILGITGRTVADHQRLTVDRYDDLLNCCYIMPVLQGYSPEDYVAHIRMYGSRLRYGMWVGVGSVCKRNTNIRAIRDVLLAIHWCRPDLRLHGFGLKTTALADGLIQQLLESADSMAWSFSARKQGRDQHDWREAERWMHKITARPTQIPLYVPSKTE